LHCRQRQLSNFEQGASSVSVSEKYPWYVLWKKFCRTLNDAVTYVHGVSWMLPVGDVVRGKVVSHEDLRSRNSFQNQSEYDLLL
jgi:hypothetical protein